ncbi:MAG: glycosyltransferase [Verrucomicrobia bacterium]|nr:glycosyltransferase [Verrucomicrobiota bacterium]
MRLGATARAIGMTASLQPAPRTALLLKTDTLGDLVLFAPALRAIRAAWPQARLTVVIRHAYRDLAPLIAPNIEWLTTTADPFAHGPAAERAEIERLRGLVAALAPDVVVAATSRRNWRDAALAAASGAPRRVALGTGGGDEIFSTQLRVQLGLDAATAFTESVAPPDDEPDGQRNLRLAGALLGHALPPTPPALALDAATRDTARKLLATLGLQPGGFVACAAAGFANVKIKTWPAEKFAAAIAHLHARHGLRALLIGHESERAHLESVRSCLPSPVSCLLWTGRDGDLPLLAALLAESALYFGNDTGAMHLAAAVDVPVVAVFGGGTWPRFAPAARHSVSVVQPLPCFGCGWECPFGDAPCLRTIAVADATAALDFALARREPAESAHHDRAFAEVRHADRLPADTRALLGTTAARFRDLWTAHLSRQHQIEGKDAAIAEKEASIFQKEAEIAALKTACEERLQTIYVLDAHVKNFQGENVALKADKAVWEKSLAALSPEDRQTAQTIADQLVHIRNIESILRERERELTELKATQANLAAGLTSLEHAKHYGRLLAEKEAVIQSLSEACAAREAVIAKLTGELSESTSTLHKLWVAISAHCREKWWRPFDAWLFTRVVEQYWMQIGVLRHYEPRPLVWDVSLAGRSGFTPDTSGMKPDLQIAIVTPSYGQEKFIERTMLSVLDQHYPRLLYAVQDGGSKDRSAEIIARHAARLRHWASVKDNGQADAVRLGFEKLAPHLAPDDAMAYLNSDDILAPGSLACVAAYFAAHPDVDVVYGHRIIIDEEDRDIGRWVMPRHDPATLEWIDYVPQETMFWRKRAWDLVGGIDPSFHFALDWDLLARFQQAGCRLVRLPYFLAAFRVHTAQKTSQDIHTKGAEEMARIRARFHGARQDDHATINRFARRTRFRGALVARLLALGLRW